MLHSLQIKNYKSIDNLKINLGRVNVFIGENGCGKSNILEAIALASAAESEKLGHEFLSSRGIRVTDPKLMRSCFLDSNSNKKIEISASFDDDMSTFEYALQNKNTPYSKWINLKGKTITSKDIQNFIKHKKNRELLSEIRKSSDVKRLVELFEIIKDDKNSVENKKFGEFIIFSPENTALRNFHKEGQIEPLGINGEGLLKLLKVIDNTSKEKLTIIKNHLALFSWFENLSIPEDISESEDSIKIKDRHINSMFDQRSANEGFLFLLFYIALFVADETPSFFAIDNIDASLNPGLCTKLMDSIVELSQQFDKQVILTTHNPAILDGIDLTDKEQKLFVISRNRDGHTKATEITAESKPKSSTNEPLKLSEAMLRGYLGGLPKGF